MKTVQLMWGFLLLALATCSASAQEVVEFEGPDDARIYVIEGNFKSSYSLPIGGLTWFYETDYQATMDVNSGALTSVGTFSVNGSGLFNGMNYRAVMDISLAMKGVSKQAGNAVRWSATAAMSGPITTQEGSFSPRSGQLHGVWYFKDMTLDPATGEQIGIMSYNAMVTEPSGQKFPLVQAPTQTTLPRPTVYASEGEWREVAGDWSTEITADVYPNKTIKGTGDLIVGDPEDPYANVDQNVKGKLNSKTDVVSLSGTGATKSTSKVKVTLNYVNSTGDTVAGKSSVNAYAQTRKF